MITACLLYFFTLKILPFCLQNSVFIYKMLFFICKMQFFYLQIAFFITLKAPKMGKKVEDKWRITPFSGHPPLT